MKQLVSERLAVKSILIILSLIVLFHLAILLGLIPFDMVWGGRLKDAVQMRRFEAISILANGIMMVVVAIRGGYLNLRVSARIITIALWLMSALFVLNTLGNLASVNSWERLIFTPLTLVLALLCLRLATSSDKRSHRSMPHTRTGTL
jgi:hypothetical protein